MLLGKWEVTVAAEGLGALTAGVELLADSELSVIHVIAPRVVEEETEDEGEEGEVVEAAAAAEGAEAAPEDDAAEKASE